MKAKISTGSSIDVSFRKGHLAALRVGQWPTKRPGRGALERLLDEGRVLRSRGWIEDPPEGPMGERGREGQRLLRAAPAFGGRRLLLEFG